MSVGGIQGFQTSLIKYLTQIKNFCFKAVTSDVDRESRSHGQQTISLVRSPVSAIF